MKDTQRRVTPAVASSCSTRLPLSRTRRAHGPQIQRPGCCRFYWSPCRLLLYLAGVRRTRRRPTPRCSRWRTGSFLTGAGMLGLATSPPLEALAHGDARGHLAQHLLLGMYAPLALVLGAPLTLLLGSIPVAARRQVGRILGSRVLHGLGHPVSAALLTVGGLYLLYLTSLYVQSIQHTTIHHLIHLHFILAGYLFAWSIAGGASDLWAETATAPVPALP